MSQNNQVEKKKFSKVPHTYVILFSVIIIMSILTYIVPAGTYDRVEDPATGRTVVDPASFHLVDPSPIGPFELMESIPNGMSAASGIIFFIFIVGGAFQMITSTGAIEAGISKIALGLKGKEKLMIPIFMVIFSIGGGTFGMAEETIVFVPIGIALARALGYDAIVGTAMITLGAAVGFSSGFMNPFTVGVAQGIAEVPLFSGIGLRLIVLVVMLAVTMTYVMRYAAKVQDNMENSVISDLEAEEKHKVMDLNEVPVLEKHHYLVLATIVIGFGFIIYGVFRLDWYITEIASAFLAMGIIGGLLGKMGPSKLAKEFVEGARGIVFGALVVGVARGILVVMQDGMIIDTLINGLASAIQVLPSSIAVVGMMIVQVIINFFIPSGSGQAAATMPIMTPLSDIIGVTRQTAVLAYQFGDGFTNSIIPTSATLMAALSIGKVPYERWVKFLWPLMLIWIGIGAAFMIVADIIQYGPF